MIDWVTQSPYVWYAAGLVLIVVLLYLANWYEDHRLPEARRSLEGEDPR